MTLRKRIADLLQSRTSSRLAAGLDEFQSDEVAGEILALVEPTKTAPSDRGLGSVQRAVLMAMEAAQEPIRCLDMARTIKVNAGTVSRTLKGLEGRGLIAQTKAGWVPAERAPDA